MAEQMQDDAPIVEANSSEPTPSESVADNGVKEPVNTGEQNKAEPTGADENIDYKARYADSTRNFQKIDQERKEIETQLNQTLQFITKDREKLESYLDHIDIQGEQRENLLVQLGYTGDAEPKQESPEGEPVAPTPKLNDILATDPILNEALGDMKKQKVEVIENRKRHWADFESNPDNVDLRPDQKQMIANMALYLDEKEGLSPQDAIAEAKRRVVNPQSYQDEGYLKGLADNKYTAGRASGGVSSASGQSDSDQLAPEHEALIQLTTKGKSAEEVENFRKIYKKRLEKRKRI